jgi:hypothetical protein
MEVTAIPIFLPTVPERNPRTLCGCQPVAFISSLDVTPPGRFSSSRIVSVLLPSRGPFSLAAFTGRAAFGFGVASRAALGAFLAGLAFFADLALAGATLRARYATLAFFVALGWSPVAVAWAVAAVSSAVVIILVSPLAVIAVTTSITLVRPKRKGNLSGTVRGDGTAMESCPCQ